ncbi:MAG: SAM-dependent methyltransferase, partial [Emergencia sp.]
MIVEHGMISFLQKFDEQPFLVKLGGKEYQIGEGEPTFTVKFNESIPLSDLMTSTSIALGEAYMDGKLQIEGDLYEALD